MARKYVTKNQTFLCSLNQAGAWFDGREVTPGKSKANESKRKSSERVLEAFTLDLNTRDQPVSE